MNNMNESILVDIRKIPERYRSIFAAYPSFNRVQSRIFYDVFDSDHSVVLSAPTGSGKTVIFELAIVRQLIAAEKSKYSKVFQLLYISPMKALCEERLIDWHKKFSPFGINCISITGDSDFIDFHSLSNHNLIITTPEKWDSISRKWKENKQLMQIIKLFMIDEVHLLNEENRGATLEAVVCRMKTIQSSFFDQYKENLNSSQNIRFLAVSATFPNIEDVGNWLGARYYSFENCMRPVKLNTLVLGFNYNRSFSSFKFDISLNYKLPALILKYSNGKPTLIFCSTRKSVEMAAKHLIQTLTVPLSQNQKDILLKAGSSITDAKLKSAIIHGIGYHHGGLLPETRSIIEQLFRNGGLPVLVTTSTLATGVNLPAHLVIIKSTKFYDKGGFQDYPASALLQMIGRAGRPQFDTEATALILTTTADKTKFERMVEGKENIESNLHRHLTEHLNAEIVLRTITDLDVAMRWLSSTFLYIRARKNPGHYGIPSGFTPDKIDKKLLEICQIDLNKLVKNGMASMDEDVNISPTFLGNLMAKYYISFETMKLLKSLNGTELLQQILMLISKSKEFSDMRLRVDEKKCLNLLNKTKNENSIRFPFSGKIKTLDMKIACIIQAIFGCLEIEDQSIVSEAFRIMRLGERICRCLIEYLESRENCYSALLNGTVLWKCFRTQLWENSKHIAKQFPGVGTVTSKQLVNAEKTSFEKIIRTNPREIEMITNKKPPFGNKMVEYAKSVPRYDMKLEKIRSTTDVSLKITLLILNPESLDVSTFVSSSSVMCLLVGDNLNNILLYERYMHSYMIENIEVVRHVPLNLDMKDLEEVYCNFISEDLVGIDLSETFRITENCDAPVKENKAKIQTQKSKKVESKSKASAKQLDPKYSSYVQTYMDKYMKSKKNAVNEPKPQRDNTLLKKPTISRENEEIQKENNSETGQLKNSELPSLENITKFRSGIDTKIPNDKYSNGEEITEKQGVKSFTDEEMLASVEFLLENNEVREEKNLATPEKQPQELGSSLTVDLTNDKEFSKLCDKYSMNNGNEKNGEQVSRTDYLSQLSKNKFVQKSALKNLKKGKIHSVESFEDSLFNPKTDSLSLFRYQPSKRLAHSPRNNDPPSAPNSKRKKFNVCDEKLSEDMMENLEKFIGQNEKESMQYSKSIKWRSPLVYSPPVKYSPKISSSFSFSVPMPKNDSENSHDWSLNTVETNNSGKSAATAIARKTSSNTFNYGTPMKQNQVTKFPLSDRGYQNFEKPQNIPSSPNFSAMRTPQKSKQIQDFFSQSFLEDVGYPDKQKPSNLRCLSQKSQDLNTSVQSAGSYYHDMVAKNADAQRVAEMPKRMPQKPFFLSQNQLTMPVNNYVNTGGIPRNASQMSQPVRGFARYDVDKLGTVASPNIPTRALDMRIRDSFERSWQAGNDVTCLGTSTHMVPKPDFDARNLLNTSTTNLGSVWPYSSVDFMDQNNQLGYDSLRSKKYVPPNTDIFLNTSTNFPRQNSLTNRISSYNIPGNYLPPHLLPAEPPQTVRNEHYFVPRSGWNIYPPSLENTNNKENINHQSNTNSCEKSINRTQNDSFFLNQPSNPTFYGELKDVTLWNTYCDIHRIYNCSYCFDQNLRNQHNMPPNFGFELERQKLISAMAPARSTDLHRRRDVSNGYYGGCSIMPAGQHYTGRPYQENHLNERNVSNPYLMQQYSQYLERIPQSDRSFQNSYEMQNMNVVRGEFPVENNGDSKTEEEKASNKTYMLSKFLNSFDDPKNQG